MMCSWPPGQALSLSGVQCKHLLYQVEDGQSTFLDVQVCSLSQRVDCKVRCVQANGGNCDTGWDSQVLCAPWPHAFNLRVFSTQFRKSCRERPAILALLWKLDFSVLESFGTQDTDLRCWFIPSKRHYTCIFAFIVLVINGIHDALMLLLCRGLQVIHTVWPWPALSDFLMEIYKPKQLKYRMYIHHYTSKLGSGAFCWRPSLCVWALHDVTCSLQHIATTVWSLCHSNCWCLTEVLQFAALGQSFLQRLADFAAWDEVEVLTDVVR